MNHHARHKLFQSTPPARGATDRLLSAAYTDNISIHAPREGGDALTWLVPRL